MNYNPTVDYRSERDRIPSDAPNEPRSWIVEAATWVALSISVAVWAVVGFLLWLPLLLRQIGIFIVGVTYATLTNGDADAPGRRLRDATTFYRRGFLIAFRSVFSAPDGESDEERSAGASFRARPILQEIAWALLVWYPVLLFLGIAELTPADLWNAVAGVPWSETATELMRAASTLTERWATDLGL